uniref:hypothetical protein n=1 Tax=Trichocoleus desertorum TaxID=1481672 RepID=UPI0025B5143E|nr:hypothetical protein [Trichocoleus desertorum]
MDDEVSELTIEALCDRPVGWVEVTKPNLQGDRTMLLLLTKLNDKQAITSLT